MSTVQTIEMPSMPTLANAKAWHHEIGYDQRIKFFQLVWGKVENSHKKYPVEKSVGLNTLFVNYFQNVWQESSSTNDFIEKLSKLCNLLEERFRKVFFEQFIQEYKDTIKRIMDEYNESGDEDGYTIFSKIYLYSENPKLQSPETSEGIYKILDVVRNIIIQSQDLIPKEDIFNAEQEKKRLTMEEEERRNAKRRREALEKERKKEEIARKRRERLEATQKREEEERRRRAIQRAKKIPYPTALTDIFTYYEWNEKETLFNALEQLSKQIVNPEIHLELSSIIFAKKIAKPESATSDQEMRVLVDYMEQRAHFTRLSETEFSFQNNFLQNLTPSRKVLIKVTPSRKDLFYGDVARSFHLFEASDTTDNDSFITDRTEEILPPNAIIDLNEALDFYMERLGKIEEMKLEISTIGDVLLPGTGMNVVKLLQVSYEPRLEYASFFISFNVDHPDITIIVDLNDGSVLRVESDINDPRSVLEAAMSDNTSKLSVGGIVMKLYSSFCE